MPKRLSVLAIALVTMLAVAVEPAFAGRSCFGVSGGHGTSFHDL
jgi:hypothetical protein